jgi:hypothetical protein
LVCFIGSRGNTTFRIKRGGWKNKNFINTYIIYILYIYYILYKIYILYSVKHLLVN